MVKKNYSEATFLFVSDNPFQLSGGDQYLQNEFFKIAGCSKAKTEKFKTQAKHLRTRS